jgi:uncharacterized protein (DUF885 family)
MLSLNLTESTAGSIYINNSITERENSMTQLNSIEATYDQLSEEFFDIFYTYYPVHATRQGLHQYDNSLGHYRREEIGETLRRMKHVQAQVAAINPKSMDQQHALDYPVLTTRMKREIYWIETWRFWENNPLFYKDIITEGLFNLVSRNFAPLEERLKSLIAREKDVPVVLQASRDNLVNPPQVYTDQAIRYIKGARLFFTEIPKEFEQVTDKTLLAEFQKTNQVVLAELDDFLEYLQNDLFPRSKGNFAVGEAGIQAILDAEEMIDVPVKKILERLYHDYDQTDAAIKALIKQIDPQASEEDIENRICENHPTRENLMQVTRSTLKEMRDNLTQYHLLTLPPEMPDVFVSRMPTYAGASGMMLTPGPFEYVAKEAYMAVNLPQSDWSEEQTETQLRDFNPYSMRLLFAHEAYPGHHVQFYMEKRVALRASKDHDSDSNSDGWAEYGKYMMVSEIYGQQDPLYNYQVLRDKRGMIVCSIVGLEIHMGLRTLENAADWLVAKSGRTREGAYRVLDRAIYYPTHLTYYIGGEMVRKLHDDYQKLKGSQFSLQEFNDHFLTYGLIPLKVIRQAMLGAADDGVLF